MTPKEMWDNFIKELHLKEPLKNDVPHKSFIGSITGYRKIFMDANKEKL